MTIEDLTMRLEAVERANRCMRTAGGLGLVLAMAVLFVGQSAGSDRVVRAERFEVVNSKGRVRGWLESGENGQTSLTLLRPDQGIQVDVPGAPQAREEGARRGMTLRVDANGSQSLTMGDERGSTRAEVVVGSDGAPGFLIHAGSKRSGAGLCASPDGLASLDFKYDGRLLAMFGIEKAIRSIIVEGPESPPRATLTLWDSEGNAVLRAPK